MFHLFQQQLRKLSERESCVSQSVGPAADNALADVALSQWFKFWTFFLCKAISHCLVNMKILLRFKNVDIEEESIFVQPAFWLA